VKISNVSFPYVTHQHRILNPLPPTNFTFLFSSRTSAGSCPASFS
jgi:hypothetical protein